MKNKTYWLIGILAIFYSCNSNFDKDKLIVDEPSEEIKRQIEVKNQRYKIVREDYIEDYLQRLFVQIEPQLLTETDSFQVVIKNLTTDYNFSSKSSISFFKDSVYANYIDEVLTNFDEENQDSIEIYWRNNQYLGEYSFADSTLIMYPAR